jgi:hypothetical protein
MSSFSLRWKRTLSLSQSSKTPPLHDEKWGSDLVHGTLSKRVNGVFSDLPENYSKSPIMSIPTHYRRPSLLFFAFSSFQFSRRSQATMAKAAGRSHNGNRVFRLCRCLDVHTPVSHKDAAGGIAALVGSQEKYHSCNLLSLAVTP